MEHIQSLIPCYSYILSLGLLYNSYIMVYQYTKAWFTLTTLISWFTKQNNNKTKKVMQHWKWLLWGKSGYSLTHRIPWRLCTHFVGLKTKQHPHHWPIHLSGIRKGRESTEYHENSLGERITSVLELLSRVWGAFWQWSSSKSQSEKVVVSVH